MSVVHSILGAVDWSGLGVWLLTISLLIAGVIGLVMPFVPGPLILFGATLLHSWLRPASALNGWFIAMELLLLTLAFASDFLCGALGARWFGGSGWGIAGVVLGALAGLFFGLPGMILGPLIGCFVFEMIFARKPLQPAAKSALGTAVGTGVGLVSRLVIGFAMVAVFFVGAFWR